MFSTILFFINIVLFIYIVVYGACFLILPFIRPRRQLAKAETEISDRFESVTVLVPCHHEGIALISTVKSLLDQDYPGHLDVVVLVADAQDSSFAPLISHFNVSATTFDSEVVVYSTTNRNVRVVLSGCGPKPDKLNYYMHRVGSPFVAFLDADHRARIDWISTSVRQIDQSDYAGVQSRRAPLSLQKLPQLWDSAQNHIGNELANETLNRVAGTVFFTGTTCVFRRAALSGYSFSECVTEDTYLSYQLLRDGHRIGFNNASGSAEEVAPDLHSYIARRRRWSCGHNDTFFSLAPGIIRAKMKPVQKLAMLVHGLFYTVPVAVCLCLNVIALHLFVQYSSSIQLIIFLSAFALALFGTLLMFGRHKHILRESVVLFLLIFPQIALLFPLPLHYTGNEIVYFLTAFPYFRQLFWVQAFCLLAPLMLLTLGSFRVRVLPLHQLLLVVLTYPIVIFLDLWACLLGFSDFLFGRPTWAKIQRTHAEDTLTRENRANSYWVIARVCVALASVVLLIVSLNDLSADSNCGDPEGVLLAPTLFVPESSIDWRLKEEQTLIDPDIAETHFINTITEKSPTQFEVAHLIDGKVQQVTRGNESHTFRFRTKAGWEAHQYTAMLKSANLICRRSMPFVSTVKELKNNQMYINGEPFLVKGIIPSFSPISDAVTLEQGLRQIKTAGANTVRYYHNLTRSARKAVAREELLVIDQPDRSTWTDVNLNLLPSRYLLQRRFEKLFAANRDYPYLLFHLLGNEIEINNPDILVPELVDLIETIQSEQDGDWFAYATFFIYLRLPTAMNAINMLDAGASYWQKGLEIIREQNKPFLATELGGFVAYTERTPEYLRGYRLEEQWQQLLSAGAFGGVIHQSHDNWAQPIVSGINDPLSPDHPDDSRGLWDLQNQPKHSLEVVSRLFSDFEMRVADETVAPDAKTLVVTIKNKRLYSLRNIEMTSGALLQMKIEDLQPQEVRQVEISFKGEVTPVVPVTFSYSTHGGLSAISQVELHVPLQSKVPAVLNDAVAEIQVKENSLSGLLLQGDTLQIVFPRDWNKVRIAEAERTVSPGKNEIHLRSPREEVIELESSRDGKEWNPVRPEDVGKGPVRLRFRLERVYPRNALLELSGLGSNHYWFKVDSMDDWQKLPAHKYRPNLISLNDFSYQEDSYFYLLLPRFETTFLSAVYRQGGSDIEIPLEMPRVFSPAEFKIERVE